jgi:phosphatidylglycerol:prolipoprotein diacylglycerol transferase
VLFTIAYPVIDPVAVEIGPLAIRWYSLAYLFGLILGWQYARWLCRLPPQRVPPVAIDDFLMWATLGVIVGGRLGFVLLVRPGYFLEHPAEVLQIWQGGMSFHGGLLGVVVAAWLFARARRLPRAAFADVLFCAAPIGLFLGRIANFINNELVGRPADVPWAMVFPGWGEVPRHPSQLYEAALEGLVLFAVLFVLARRAWVRRRAGLLSGVFLVGYGLARGIAEQFREIDPLIGLIGPGLTMGQVLSVPMLLAGGWLIARALRRRPEAASSPPAA